MTPSLTVNLLRALFVILAAFIGSALGEALFKSILVGAVLGSVFGLSVVLIDRLLKGVSLRIFSSATFGLLLGLIFARLLMASGMLRFLPDETQWLIGMIVYLTCAYLGMMLAIRSHRDEFSIIIPFVRFRQTGHQEPPVIIDSNICIDGRILPLAKSGFVSRSLLVPRFIIDELQLLADSSDQRRRERGRRGLDTLATLQNLSEIEFSIHETESVTDQKVDARLIHLAQLSGCPLLTNDVNLGKAARIQHVRVLLLHDLENAVKMSIAVGDSLTLELTKPGRDPQQAVGYLPDGTMIVVNKAAALIGSTAQIRIASVVPTAAGRLTFAELV